MDWKTKMLVFKTKCQNYDIWVGFKVRQKLLWLLLDLWMADDLKIHLLAQPADRWLAGHIACPWVSKADCFWGVQ